MTPPPFVRRPTRGIRLGDTRLGNGAPLPVQSMLTQGPTDDAALHELERLQLAGCDVVRVAVPDREAAAALGRLVRHSPLPLVADVHYELGLARIALDQGAAGVRVNPGTAGSRPDWRALARSAAQTGSCIRVGANAGSPPASARAHPRGVLPGLVEAVLDTAAILMDHGAPALKLSVKCARVPALVAVTRQLYAGAAERQGTPWPLHLGLTEAGPPPDGEIKSAAALAILLADGLGDTLRISLAADPVWEVHAAHRLLRALGLSDRGTDVVACPTCARCRGPVIDVAQQLRRALDTAEDPALSGRTLAVMGCPVNGPGEARAADAGAAAARDHWVLFRAGQVCGKATSAEVVEALLALARR